MNRLRRREDGFTLPEILMVVVILGIIFVPLTGSVFAGFRTTDKTAKVLASSADRQLVSVYFPPDVQSASSVDTGSGGATCTGGDAGTRIVRFEWREFDSAGPTPTTTLITTFVADYRLVAAGAGSELVRFSCVNSGTATRLAVAHHLTGPTPASVAVNGATVSITLTDLLGTQYTVAGVRRLP